MRKKTNRKMLRNVFFFLGLMLFTFWFIFKDQDMGELFSVVASADKVYLILGIVCMFMYYLIEAYNVRSILVELGERKISIFSGLKFTFIGFFFSSITPASTGGQPIEIYYMNKENINGAKATLALLIELCGFQISTIFYGVLCAILNPYLLKDGLVWLFLLGLTINGFALTLMLICIFSPKLTRKILNVIVKMLRIFKVKNVEFKKAKLELELEKYIESSAFIKSHMKTFTKAILRVFVQIGFYYLVPFCVYKAFGLSSHNMFELFAMQAVLYTTVSGLPLPGSIGVSETVFLRIFGIAFGKTLLGGAMLLSRGVTFYLYVIISLIVVIINAVKKKKIKSEIDKKIIGYELEAKQMVIQ